MNPQELTDALRQFTGTEHYHRLSIGFPNVVLTDGAKFLSDTAGAYWLMVMIASHLPSVPKDEGFAIARLKRHNGGAIFTLTDDIPPTTTYAKQEIDYTDFPLDDIKLYVARQDDLWVVMLPSEY